MKKSGSVILQDPCRRNQVPDPASDGLAEQHSHISLQTATEMCLKFKSLPEFSTYSEICKDHAKIMRCHWQKIAVSQGRLAAAL